MSKWGQNSLERIRPSKALIPRNGQLMILKLENLSAKVSLARFTWQGRLKQNLLWYWKHFSKNRLLSIRHKILSRMRSKFNPIWITIISVRSMDGFGMIRKFIWSLSIAMEVKSIKSWWNRRIVDLQKKKLQITFTKWFKLWNICTARV